MGIIGLPLTEIRGGSARQQEVAQDQQVKLLSQEIAILRDRLRREAQAYGELRAQSARHEVIAKDALSRATNLEARLVLAQQSLGSTEAQMVELEARLQFAAAPVLRTGNVKPKSRRSSKGRKAKRQTGKAKAVATNRMRSTSSSPPPRRKTRGPRRK